MGVKQEAKFMIINHHTMIKRKKKQHNCKLKDGLLRVRSRYSAHLKQEKFALLPAFKDFTITQTALESL